MSNTSYKLPSIEELLSIEKKSNKNPQTLAVHNLNNNWTLHSVLRSQTQFNNSIISFLLRALNAKLDLHTIKKEIGSQDEYFYIGSSVEFLKLQIRFEGKGSLNLKNSLLTFNYEKLKILILGNSIIKISLKIPEGKNSPFFKIIGIAENHEWFSAKGRGGGLALWTKSK
tara:strand:+ start:159 stop:668 length:510 start_codon:yes stop_codon:yes gene_type:complete